MERTQYSCYEQSVGGEADDCISTPTNIMQKKTGGTSSRIVKITNDAHDTTAAATLTFSS